MRDSNARDGFLGPIKHVQSQCDFNIIFMTFVSFTCILLLGLTSHRKRIIGGYQSGFRCNRWTSAQKLCIRQIPRKEQCTRVLQLRFFVTGSSNHNGSLKRNYELKTKYIIYRIKFSVHFAAPWTPLPRAVAPLTPPRAKPLFVYNFMWKNWRDGVTWDTSVNGHFGMWVWTWHLAQDTGQEHVPVKSI